MSDSGKLNRNMVERRSEDARKYLAVLREIKDIKGFKHHWGVLNDKERNKL